MRISENTVKDNELVSRSSEKILTFGTVELEENDKSQTVILDVGYLEKVMKMLKTINDDTCCIRIETSRPVLIYPGESYKSLTGILLAPRTPID